jgi:hypothetical protein
MTALPPRHWYGSRPAWQVALEAGARRAYGEKLTITVEPGRLIYRVALDIRGPLELVDVVIAFWADPPYNTYGLPPQDYPRVHAEPGAASPHRMPGDDALCLWFPWDPTERRWTHDKGLLDLLDITTDHLLLEGHWRATGGLLDGVWDGEEAEHGFVLEAA